MTNELIEETMLKVMKELTLGGSCGNIPKWLLCDSISDIYAKGRSKETTFEPEAEVCAYELSKLFGVPAIPYKLVNISTLSTLPICVSSDYSKGYKILSLYRYVELLTTKNPAKYNGAEKLELVLSVLNSKDIELHMNILYFDYLVGNKDRHLRNFDVRVLDGKLVDMVYMFDTGACLFSTESVDTIRRACTAGNNFVPAKPYNSVQYGQVKLLQSLGYECTLKSTTKVSIYKTINSYFKKDRAKYLGQYVVQNAERLGLLC